MIILRILAGIAVILAVAEEALLAHFPLALPLQRIWVAVAGIWAVSYLVLTFIRRR